jgi:tetratricopeptide (TPR) repeat protein
MAYLLQRMIDPQAWQIREESMPRTVSLLIALILTGTAAAQSADPWPWFDPTSPKFTESTEKTLPPHPPAQQSHRVDKTRLRKLAYLPQLSMSFNMQCELGTTLDPQATAKRIVALENELQGDATDAERCAELAGLYEEDNRPEKVCDEAFAKARQLFQERIKIEPANGWLHAQLVPTLWPDAAAMEAEALEAIRCSPRDFRCWGMLGEVRFRLVIEPLFGTGKRPLLPKGLSWHQLFERIAANKLSQQQLKQAEKGLQESLRCFDKAVSIAPDEIEAYQSRLAFQYFAFYFRWMFSELQHQPLPDCRRGFQDTDIFNDMRQILRLRHDDPEILRQQASLCWTAAMFIQVGKKTPSGSASGPDEELEVSDILCKETKIFIAEAVEPLEKLAKCEQSGQAAFACRRLALCFICLGELAKAEVQAAWAIELDPTCEESWDLLLYSKRAQDKQDHGRRSYAAFKQKVQPFPTPRSHLFLAKECVDLQQVDEAESELRAALKDHPEDVPCRIGLAATLLLKDDQSETVAEARQCLNQLAKSISESEDKEQAVQILFLHAICAALEGQSDLSYRLFKSIPPDQPKKDWVHKALALFDGSDQ